MTGIKVNKGCDIYLSAVFIDRVSILCGIQKKFFNAEFRKVCLHGQKGMEKWKHVMPGSPFQKWEYREVAVGIGCHIHVEVAAEEIVFPMRVPSPVAVRLRVLTFTVTGKTAVFLTIAGSLFSLLCGSADRSAVIGKSRMVRINQPFADRNT